MREGSSRGGGSEPGGRRTDGVRAERLALWAEAPSFLRLFEGDVLVRRARLKAVSVSIKPVGGEVGKLPEQKALCVTDCC